MTGLANIVSVLALAVLLAAGLPARPRAEDAGPPLAITGLAHRAEGGRLRLAVGLGGEARWSLFHLVDPWRLVIDLPPFAWTGADPALALPPGIRAIRHGLFRHDTGRIVLELERPMAVAQALTRIGPAPARLTLELLLEPVAADAFAAGAGWPDGAHWDAPGPAVPEGGGILVAIDPGHGGLDPGATVEGLVEKHIVLDFGRLLVAEINARPGLTAFLTREDDRFVPLRERVRIAREAGAHLLVSLHTDSVAAGGADGASVYTLSREGTDSAADAFAERENRADVMAGVDLGGEEDDVTRLLIELARRGSGEESIRLAEAIIAALRPGAKLLDTRPHRRGNFFVLKAPELPSVLVELGFLSSPADRARLADPDWRLRMAAGIADGVAGWLAGASPGFLRPRARAIPPGRDEPTKGRP